MGLAWIPWLMKRWVFLVGIVVVLCLGAAGYVVVERLDGIFRSDVRAHARADLAILIATLRAETDTARQAARCLSGSPSVLRLFSDGGPKSVADANSTLDRYRDSFLGAVCFLMDGAGLTLASSNRDAADSFVGHNYAFRPYFQAARIGSPGQYFGLGVTSRRRGYYASHPVPDSGGGLAGVTVLKVELDDWEEVCAGPTIACLVDPHGIVFLSNRPDLRLRSLWPLSPESLSDLVASRQFGAGSFAPIFDREFLSSPDLILEGKHYLFERAPFEEGYEVVLLAPLTAFRHFRSLGMLITLLCCLGAAGIFLALGRRHAYLARLREDATALARYRDHLQNLVHVRTQELEAKNVELERSTYTVSHDLKAPLTTIMGFAGVLEQQIAGFERPDMLADCRRISAAAERMHLLLDRLLEFSRIGRIDGVVESVDLGRPAREAIDQLAAECRERGVTVHVAADLPVVQGDPLRLQQVFENLIQNAVKYLGDQVAPRVEVGFRHEKKGPVIFVRDNGVGIAPKHHRRIFGLFEQLDAQSKGTGVGLAIVQRIVESHGGRVWVESVGVPGRGSTFCFTLPGKVRPATADGTSS